MPPVAEEVSYLQEVRRKLFARVRHSVCSKLFLAKPTFCQHLVEINHFVSDISQVKMSYCNSNHLYQLEEYSDLQVVTREQKAKPALESTSEKVQQVISLVTAAAVTLTVLQHPHAIHFGAVAALHDQRIMLRKGD